MAAEIKHNLSAVLYDIDNIQLEHRDIPEVGDYDALLEMCCVGICGSDVHYWKRGRIADFIVKEPMVMGHESSGIVVKVGSKIRHLKAGDRVAIEPGVPCRRCLYCKKGQYNLCPDIVFCATPPHHGNMGRYYVHPADFCYKLPDNVSLEEGALLEPLSVGVHACRRGNVQVGSTVLILGCGPIGLVTLLTAKAMGASKVVITDIIESRLEVAKELGADYTVVVKPNDSEEHLSEVITELLEDMPSITIDCSGFETTIKLGLKVTKPGGTLVVVGMGAAEVKIPLISGLCKEVDIKGCFRYANDYESALAMVATGKVNVKRLITHNYKMEEVVKAFDTAHTGAGNAIKVMIHCRSETSLYKNEI